MNMQAIMKQAQTLQKEMLKSKEEIDNTDFTGKNSFVTVVVNGKKEIKKIKIEAEKLEKEDIEMLEDMITIAINNAFKDVDKLTEEKMGKYTNIPGLF
ncbi:MAG: YbaB/EbfC family nucleoid-associated protein [Bacilli bacterium]